MKQNRVTMVGLMMLALPAGVAAQVETGKATSQTTGQTADTTRQAPTMADQQLGGVTVTAVRRSDTETAAVQEVKRSANVVNNVSAQEIKRTQDANAGEVIRRIPGVSLIDDKFVMVRGLQQRYNNVWINGAAVPSSEADSRAFSFDMIPSGQIDNLTVVKTPAAEYPADYTGGFILVNTKEIPISNSLHISLGAGWNSQSALRTFYSQKSSATDFLGFDSGLRTLSGGMDKTFATLGRNVTIRNKPTCSNLF